MKFLEERIQRVRGLLPAHLSEDSDLQEVARNAFEARRLAIAAELDGLRKLQQINTVSTIFGLALVFLSCGMFLLGRSNLGVASGVSGLLIEFIPVFVGSQIGKARESLRSLLPEYSDLFALVTTLDARKAIEDEQATPDGD